MARWVAYFAFYALLGWLLEVAFRSWRHRHLVNPGLLHGPFLPLYGGGALAVLAIWGGLPWLPEGVRLLLFSSALVVGEYLAGYTTERLFKIKLWDYSDSRFNIHGRVSLPFSLVWAALAWGGVRFLHPSVAQQLGRLDGAVLQGVASGLGIYFAADLLLSVAALTSLANKLAPLLVEHIPFSRAEIERLSAPFKRLIRAFPHLKQYWELRWPGELSQRVGPAIGRLQKQLIAQRSAAQARHREYAALVADIEAHSEFQRLGTFFHHDASILAHVRRVSRRAYAICKWLHLDYRSAARGALLHDFFLYDWRRHELPDLAKERFHAFAHPAIALDNASRYFDLNPRERDIIGKHMWPLTLRPPRYAESLVVSLVDKAVALHELLTLARNAIRRRRKP